MASKQSMQRPGAKVSSGKVSTRSKQKMIVYGYIRLSFFQYPRLINKIMPQVISDMIYAFVTFRDYITVAFVGHFHSGKSTLCGYILRSLGYIDDAQWKRCVNCSEEIGKASFKYAFIMDRARDERGRGVTINGSTKYQFTAGTYKYAMIDVPGHRDFLKNTTRLLSMADVAVLVVPISSGYFETSITKSNPKKGSIEGQTISHARLCHVLGVEQMIVVFNKMDELAINGGDDNMIEINSHQRYIECKEKVHKILKKIGFKTKKITYIPISAYCGKNIVNVCNDKSYLKWYKGFKIKKKHKCITGFTLFDAFRDVIEPNNRLFMNNINKSFKMSISNCYRIKGVGHVIRGRIICGGIKAGNNNKIKPFPASLYIEHDQYKYITPFSIEKNYENVNAAECGDIVSINIKGWDKKIWYEMQHKKQIFALSDDDNPPKLTKTFTTLVFVTSHVGRLNVAKWQRVKKKRCNDYVGGYTPTIFVSTWRCPCKLIKINWVNKKGDKNKKIENVQYIEQGDTAEVTFKALMPFIVYPFHEIKSYGRILVIDNCHIVLIGKVLSVVSE